MRTQPGDIQHGDCGRATFAPECLGYRATRRCRSARRGGGATVCDMRTVSHREMRNNSGELLRAVAAGESVRVTNRGQVAALLVPPDRDPLAALRESGQVRPARRPTADLSELRRRPTRLTSAEILADSRGPW